MRRFVVISWTGIIAACAMLPSQKPTAQSSATPITVITSFPMVTISSTEIYSIPEQEAPKRIFATLPKSKVIGLQDIEIAQLLLDEFLNKQMMDDTEINKITDYEITKLSPEAQMQGRFFACYIMTPASKIFVMTSPARELKDGRVEACNVFGASKDALSYYLSGYYGG